MTSFLARTFAVLADKPATICAVLGTSRRIMNCSAVPVTLSTDETWDLLCAEDQPSNEQQLLQLFSTFSDTMQFTEKLRFQSCPDEDFVKGILKNLITNKRYFTRTIRLLELPFAESLFKACCTQSPKTHRLSNLRSLTIEGTSTLNIKHTKTLCLHCPFLETLNIPGQKQLTDDDVEFVSSLNHLQSLNLSWCGFITDSGLQHLTKLSSLQSLNVEGCARITDGGLEHLARLASLRALNLTWCREITDVGLQHLAKLSSFQSLNLVHCYKITDAGLEHLAKLSSLQSLDLESCKLITDNGLQHLAKLPSLRLLNLRYCDNITDEGCRVLSASTKVIH